jgi:hypothetical protein
LERGEVDEARASRVRRYNEDVIVAIWEVGGFAIFAFSRMGIFAMRRRGWRRSVHVRSRSIIKRDRKAKAVQKQYDLE